MSSLVLCLHPSYPYLKPKRVGIQIPPAIPSKLSTCPFLSANWTQLSICKKLFFTISSHCLQARSFRGPSTLCAPYRLLSYYHTPHSFSSIDLNSTINSTLNSTLSSALNSTPNSTRSRQKPKTASETYYFLQEDKIIQIVPILINILIMLCISLYHIGNGGNKLFVFVFVKTMDSGN